MADPQSQVRIDEKRIFTSIVLGNGDQVTGRFWITRGYGDLQGVLGPVLTDGRTFYPLGLIRSFSL